MSEGVRPDLRKSLDNLLRQPWNAIKRKLRGNSSALVLPSTFDLGFLPAQIPFVLHGRLNTRDIDIKEILIDIQNDSLLGDERGETDLRAPERLGCRF